MNDLVVNSRSQPGITLSTEDVALALWPTPAEVIVLREALIAYLGSQDAIGSAESELRYLAAERLLRSVDSRARSARPRSLTTTTSRQPEPER